MIADPEASLLSLNATGASALLNAESTVAQQLRHDTLGRMSKLGSTALDRLQVGNLIFLRQVAKEQGNPVDDALAARADGLLAAYVRTATDRRALFSIGEAALPYGNAAQGLDAKDRLAQGGFRSRRAARRLGDLLQRQGAYHLSHARQV